MGLHARSGIHNASVFIPTGEAYLSLSFCNGTKFASVCPRMRVVRRTSRPSTRAPWPRTRRALGGGTPAPSHSPVSRRCPAGPRWRASRTAAASAPRRRRGGCWDRGALEHKYRYMEPCICACVVISTTGYTETRSMYVRIFRGHSHRWICVHICAYTCIYGWVSVLMYTCMYGWVRVAAARLLVRLPRWCG